MKNIYLTFCLLIFSVFVSATNHDVVVNSASNSFSPVLLTIDVGDSVTFKILALSCELN